ncbi:MAG TPA: inorganic phosphate transporter [Patescibacteria group bacterium]|nr:inorganic phosphate transporter [Patescibacteria group bacterium]
MNLGTLGLFALPCAFGVVAGFNDGGSLLASFTSGRVISPRSAALLLLVVPLGPLVVGTAVAETIGVSIVDLPALGRLAFVGVVGVAIVVVLVSWGLRAPTSMTLALVGAMVGWALVAGASIRWAGVARVVVGIPLSVLGGGLLALLLYRLVRGLLGAQAHRRMLLLARLQIASAAFQAFAYGANDMAKTMGLVAVARVLSDPKSPISFHDALPLGLAYASFACGAVVGGWRLARRVGFGIYRVRPVQAMAEQMAAGAVVAALAAGGAPVSSTQTINGALVGVGAAVRASAIRWGVVREMVASWFVTLPLAIIAAGLLRYTLTAAGMPR